DCSAAGRMEKQPLAALVDRWLPQGVIAHVQLNDRNRQGPGQGQQKFAPLFAALRKHRYGRDVAVEPFDYVPVGPGAAARAIGYALAVAVAVPLAIAITSSQRFDSFVMPTLLFFQVVPKVAVAPLFLVWFGVGALPKILVAFLISFFPIVIDAAVGLRSMSGEMTDLARSMGASRMQVFARFRLPTSLPYLFSGLKVAAALAVAGAVVGEVVGGGKGVGYLLLVTNSNTETALMFAPIVALTIIGLAFFYAVELLEALLIPWHVTHRIRGDTGTL